MPTRKLTKTEWGKLYRWFLNKVCEDLISMKLPSAMYVEKFWMCIEGGKKIKRLYMGDECQH